MPEVFPLLLAGHFVGDWIAQTDWQAANKMTNWRANQLHILTYHLTLGVFVLPVWRTWGTVALFAVSWVTHGFLDRRWPVKWLLAHTGSKPFSETPLGILAADQALHIAILAVASRW